MTSSPSATDAARWLEESGVPRPRSIVRPDTLEEARRIVEDASFKGEAMTPLGGGMHFTIGNPPNRVDLILHTTSLNHTVEYVPEEMTLTVEAGMHMDAVEKLLAAKGQMLPLECYGFTGATVGGVIAANQSGPRRLLYGSARDFVLGLRAILPDGSLIKAGGKVVKNVSGYDLRKLFIGSFGTLGLIGEASFKVYPIHEREATLLANYSQLEDACHVASAILNSHLMPQTLEITQPRFNEAVGREAVFSDGYTVAVGFCGLKEEVKRETSEAEDIAKRSQPRKVDTLTRHEHVAFMRDLREFPILARQSAAERAVGFKMALLISKVPHALNAMAHVAAKEGVDLNWVSHAGLGIIHATVASKQDQFEETKILVNALTEMRQVASEFEGSLVVEAAPRSVMRRLDAWGVNGPTVEIMRRIKAQFDPGNLMNPGRFVGGI
ncbi:MAG: FAD-binding oxidoreductase [Candidatus Bathyarchaeia archaeon]